MPRKIVKKWEPHKSVDRPSSYEASVWYKDQTNTLVRETDNVAIYKDKYPACDGHLLFIPKRHVEDYFGLYQPELNSFNKLLVKHKESLMSRDKNVTGFNVGMNNGEDAGQTIYHCHIHLIPRRKGDIENPRGGIRGVIPEKKEY